MKGVMQDGLPVYDGEQPDRWEWNLYLGLRKHYL